MEVEKGKVRAPEMGAVWLNSEPLEMRRLRGRVVLADFWDYTCVNCLRTLPYTVEWHRRYAEKGLVIIGVHTPEFSFAATGKFVGAAVERAGIRYPVVLDNSHAIWRAFANRCWPAKYLIDKDGYIRFFHFGEGDYAGTEKAIQQLLREANASAELPAVMEPVRDTDRPGAVCYRTTPELYLGHARGKLGNASGFLNKGEDRAARYELPERLDADVFYLSGAWLAKDEFARSAEAKSSVLVYYTAKEVNLVMAPEGEPVDAEILHDGNPLGAEAGADVATGAGGGRSTVRVDSPRMYNLARNSGMKQRLLQLVARGPGLECYAFTFTTCTAQDDPPW